MMFPPELVPHIKSSLAGHPVLLGVSDEALADLLTIVFFASLEREEGAHLPIRVVFSGVSEGPSESTDRGSCWIPLAFARPRPCSAKELCRLSRVTISDWTFVQAAICEGKLMLRGLARQALGAENDPYLVVASSDTGRLEIWAHGRRELEYAHGRLMPAPENVLLSAGPVQRALQRGATSAGVSARAWPHYLDAVGGVVRSMSAHGHGGILIVTSEADETNTAEGQNGFFTNPSPTLFTALEQLGSIESHAPSKERVRSYSAHRAALNAEVERAVGELGGLTALDGATVVERRLCVRAFGVILPAPEHIEVFESSDAEPNALVPFRLDDRGARHRAAAAFARDRPESVVFVASTDGDLACMLREANTEQVLVWRFSG